MSKQGAFFLSKYEIFQQEHPEKVTRKKSLGKRQVTPKVFDCSTCGLDKKCRNSNIKRYGKGQKDILVVGTYPGPSEDKIGVPFVGADGGLLKKMFKLIDIDLDKDCVRTNALRCFPGKDKRGRTKEPTKNQILCCAQNLQRDIEEVQPKLIICLGTLAVNSVLKTDSSLQFPLEMMHGKTVPYHKHNCWVGCAYHPNFFLSRKHSERVPDDDIILAYDLAKIIGYLNKPLPQPLTKEGNECITNADEAVDILERFCESKKPISFDYETNRLSSYYKDSEIISVSLTDEVESAIFIPLGFKDKDKYIFTEEERTRIILAMREFLRSDAPKCIQNYNMEELWSRNIIGQSVNNFIWDTMISAHVINCHPRSTGLGFQAFEMTGHIYKEDVDAKNIGGETLEDLCNYNSWDSRYTLMSYYKQKSILDNSEKNLAEFNDFFTKSIPILANFTDRGVKIDSDLLNEFDTKYSAMLKEQNDILSSSLGIIRYEKESEQKFNINSSSQIGKILYDIYKVEKWKITSTGRGSTDAEALQIILEKTENSEVKKFISIIFEHRKIIKIIERAIEYQRLIDPEDYVHPIFNLNITRTYRSSADGPNIQNVFERDEEQRKFKRCIIPTPGNIWIIGDFKGLEVSVIGMVSKDPELIRQIIAKVDTHKKWAAKLFEKSEDEITKPIRYRGKNEFVFPSFYGAAEDSIARSFPEKSKEHIIEVCREFWKEFEGVKEWQNRTIADYKQKGYVEFVTGARRPGPLNINKLYNTPIQGPAFHLNLDALGRIDKEMLRRGMKSRIVTEVHDSIDIDAVPEEAEEIIALAGGIMTSKRFEWQGDVPLFVSWEIGSSWYDMEEL